MATGEERETPEALLERLKALLRLKRYSIRTEQQYIGWVRRFIAFHNGKHPLGLHASDVEAFLSHLAVKRKVAASTQNQAKAALLFLYEDLLRQDLPWLGDIVHAKTPQRLPVV